MTNYIKDRLLQGFNRINNLAGTPIKIKYYTRTIGSVWDDDGSLAQAGSELSTSGLIFPLDSTRGSEDAVLMEQGRLIDDDKRLYTLGSLTLAGSGTEVKIYINYLGEYYTPIPYGGIVQQVEGVPIYKKSYIRRLTGSILGE
jgi:hypothetical protein